MTPVLLQYFYCTGCGTPNWIHTYDHTEEEDSYCVQCNEETGHEKHKSRGC